MLLDLVVALSMLHNSLVMYECQVYPALLITIWWNH